KDVKALRGGVVDLNALYEVIYRTEIRPAAASENQDPAVGQQGGGMPHPCLVEHNDGAAGAVVEERTALGRSVDACSPSDDECTAIPKRRSRMAASRLRKGFCLAEMKG